MATNMADRAVTRAATWTDRAQFAGLAAAGAGAIHLAAAGIHADHPTVARIFVVLGALQVITGLVLALAAGRVAAAVVIVVNIVAVGGWFATRTTGISWVQGLEVAENPQFADTVCAALGALAGVVALFVLLHGARRAPRVGLVAPGAMVAALSVAAMLTGTSHVHSQQIASDATGTAATAGGHVHATGTGTGAAGAGAAAGAAATPGTEHVHAAADPTAWPRPWDPTKPIDFSGVPGVTPEQQARAQALAAKTLAELPQFGDVTKIGALGFKSIGDAASGFEHYINYAYIRDDSFLDPNKPESLVYKVDGAKRTLVSAMFMAKGMSDTDPKLLDYGGKLMTWHVHEDLCWSLDANHQPIVVGVKDAAGNCPPGSINAGGGVPMVHVWITPNECGPFAALEGEGAGQTAAGTTRTDQCAAHQHTPSGG